MPKFIFDLRGPTLSALFPYPKLIPYVGNLDNRFGRDLFE